MREEVTNGDASPLGGALRNESRMGSSREKRPCSDSVTTAAYVNCFGD